MPITVRLHCMQPALLRHKLHDDANESAMAWVGSKNTMRWHWHVMPFAASVHVPRQIARWNTMASEQPLVCHSTAETAHTRTTVNPTQKMQSQSNTCKTACGACNC
jgi:hypothetical protein